MKITETIAETRSIISAWKDAKLSVGLVPTMGFLHEGHASLIERARTECDRVVVSIFVNPMQFAEDEDLDAYPRDMRHDIGYCDELGVDLIFSPKACEMYGREFYSYVDVSVLTEDLCGATRENHFRGVCTVCTKLFNIVKPHRAYFGEKDAQQLAVIRRMAHDLNMDIDIVGCPTVRESDGLAKSSRNAYLDRDGRRSAAVLYQSILAGKSMLDGGERDAAKISEAMKDVILSKPECRIDYLKIVDADTMTPVERVECPVIVAMAVYVNEKARLIDNFAFSPPEANQSSICEIS